MVSVPPGEYRVLIKRYGSLDLAPDADQGELVSEKTVQLQQNS